MMLNSEMVAQRGFILILTVAVWTIYRVGQLVLVLHMPGDCEGVQIHFSQNWQACTLVPSRKIMPSKHYYLVRIDDRNQHISVYWQGCHMANLLEKKRTASQK